MPVLPLIISHLSPFAWEESSTGDGKFQMCDGVIAREGSPAAQRHVHGRDRSCPCPEGQRHVHGRNRSCHSLDRGKIIASKGHAMLILCPALAFGRGHSFLGKTIPRVSVILGSLGPIHSMAPESCHCDNHTFPNTCRQGLSPHS